MLELQVAQHIEHDHKWYLTEALRQVEANTNGAIAARAAGAGAGAGTGAGAAPKCVVRIVTCWRCEDRRSSAVQVVNMNGGGGGGGGGFLDPGHPYGGRGLGDVGGDGGTMLDYQEREIYMIALSDVIVDVSPEADPLLHNGCRVYLRLNDRLSSSWWYDSHKSWLIQALMTPFPFSRGSRTPATPSSACRSVPYALSITQRWASMNYFHFMAESLARLVGGLDAINARINGSNPDGTELDANVSEPTAHRGRARLTAEQLRRMPVLLSRVLSYSHPPSGKIDPSAPSPDDESR